MRRFFRLFVCMMCTLVLICSNLVPAAAELAAEPENYMPETEVNDEEPVSEVTEPESVEISAEDAVVIAGETAQLAATVYPAEADQTLVWGSSDPEIVTVDEDGTIHGNDLGTAVISVTTLNGQTADCNIRVLFSDVASSSQYFYNPVYWAADHGITVGAGGFGKFSPANPCTREQIVTFLWRLQGEPEPTEYKEFTDVKPTDWFYTPISWAAEKGITVGLNDGTGRFGVGQACTREMCVTFLYRTANNPEVGEHEEFTDVAAGRYYYNSISWAASEGITVGLNDGTGRFGVGQKCTRAMIVTFLYRFANRAPSAILSTLTSDIENLIAGIETEVTFTAEAGYSDNAIYLYSEKDSEVLGQLTDDGADGDEIAGDGIYSCLVYLYSAEPGELGYYAADGERTTNTVTLTFFEPISEEQAQEDRNIEEEINNIESEFVDESGFVPEDKAEDALNAVLEYVKGLYEEGRVLYYEVNESGITFKLSSGLTLFYTPNVNGYDTVGSNVSMSVYTFQPCLSGYSGLDHVMGLVDQAAGKIGRTFSNYQYSSANDYDDGEVSLERVKQLGNNQVVLWHGHGGYSSTLHSFMVVGESFDWNRYNNDRVYQQDCVADRIIESSHGDAMITSRYIDKYCGNMGNSFFYLGVCSSGVDDVLAKSFLKKGAEAVIGNNGKIYTEYNILMLNAVGENLATINEATGNYCTLNEALAKAKETYGANDEIWHTGNKNATGTSPVIFGGSAAKNYRLGDYRTGTLSGKVCKASDRTTPIPNAVICAVGNGNNYLKVADSEGRYSLNLPVGEYKILIYAPLYIPFIAFASVNPGRNTYLETFLMIIFDGDSEGVATGMIYNAISGIGIADVAVTIKKGWNNADSDEIVAEMMTDSNGQYEATLPLGNYTLCAEKEGYISAWANIIVQNGTTDNQNCALAPESAGDSLRIILTWGENPSDLDSHVVGKLSNGNTFHVYYSDKYAYDGDMEVCNLDVDDTTSYGPETITLNRTTEGPYYYYIYRYAGSGTVGASEAKITVYQGADLLTTFNVPTDQGNGDYWNVFAIVGNEMIIRNTITDSADISYAGDLNNGQIVLDAEALPAKTE
ncbi:MAG: S-layer homology domain-containing protein [Erysipelotrichaceae bacterium]|nr:S-layer homology domain-containing protein [Erysipelotrichaceae bacterium]